MGIRPIEDISSLSHINDNKIDNIAVYTGDTYANWLLENSLETTLQGTKITYSLRDVTTSTNTNQPGTPVEYGGTAVCSSGWRISLGIVGRMLQLLQKRWPKGILVCYSYREAVSHLPSKNNNCIKADLLRPRLHVRLCQSHPPRNHPVCLPR